MCKKTTKGTFSSSLWPEHLLSAASSSSDSPPRLWTCSAKVPGGLSAYINAQRKKINYSLPTVFIRKKAATILPTQYDLFFLFITNSFCFLSLLTSRFGIMRRLEIFVVSFIKLFQSSRSIVLQKWCKLVSFFVLFVSLPTVNYVYRYIFHRF